METFLALLVFLPGESTGHRWIHLTKATDAELWCFLVRLNKRLSKQRSCWWLETPWRSLWRHCNGNERAGYWCENLLVVGKTYSFAYFDWIRVILINVLYKSCHIGYHFPLKLIMIVYFMSWGSMCLSINESMHCKSIQSMLFPIALGKTSTMASETIMLTRLTLVSLTLICAMYNY